ncbi:ATP-binding protein [Rugosimonospora africana]|nr:ATP-binding protein [Rugosimonospora africana]
MQRLTATDLDRVRQLITRITGLAGLEPDRVARLTLAVNEIATNAIQHGGGEAGVTIQIEADQVVIEVNDTGPGIPTDIAVDLPEPEATHGRGLWLANQLCDEVQLRSGATGTLVRLVMALA